MKIVPAEFVTSDTGTGLVHCAPAHGLDDYLAFRKLGLISSSKADNIICHVDSRGLLKPSIKDVLGPQAAELLAGKDVFSGGNRAMIELLQSLPGNDVLLKTEKFKHRYPYDWKTKKPVIVLATEQWFANLDDVKDKAISTFENVEFFPAACKSDSSCDHFS